MQSMERIVQVRSISRTQSFAVRMVRSAFGLLRHLIYQKIEHLLSQCNCCTFFYFLTKITISYNFFQNTLDFPLREFGFPYIMES